MVVSGEEVEEGEKGRKWGEGRKGMSYLVEIEMIDQ